MPRISLRIVLLAGFAAFSVSNSAQAQGYGPRGHARHYGNAPVRSLPPEVRYRDPRYAPAPRRYAGPLAPRFEPQPDLIPAYLPRHTNLPMYNEPPGRFPQR